MGVCHVKKVVVVCVVGAHCLTGGDSWAQTGQVGRRIGGGAADALTGEISKSLKAGQRTMRRGVRGAVGIGVVAGVIAQMKGPKDHAKFKPTRGDHEVAFRHGGRKRIYHLHIPRSYDRTKSMPLLMVLHAESGSGKGLKKFVRGGLNKIADKEGFIVVYPEGVKRNWNDGRKVQDYKAHQKEIDDVGFISSLTDGLVEKANVDPKRVYVTGMSNGAMMAYRLACEASDKIAAIASVAGAMPEPIASQCSPARAVSILAINGTEDPIVPWEGGDVKLNRQKLGRVISVPETIQQWVTRNGCPATPDVTTVSESVTRESFTGCSGADVSLFVVKGGGHTWPGAIDVARNGDTTREISAAEEIWKFFAAHPLSR